MSRTKKEWIGKTDDAMPPASVFARLWRKQDGVCPKCTRPLTIGNVTREHVKAIEDGGENRESNIQLWCTTPCARSKTGAENSRRAKADRVFAASVSAPKAKRPVPGSKNSPWAKRYNKSTGRFETVPR